ncbi:hypothetical protein ACFO0A_02195 [Novosphingobium tardum]|uniref:Uncharacterized protein n=1 Tax=Novosphingobium tardum TaxID=1538021 RepID=A0ABV8RKC1_9SPHN
MRKAAIAMMALATLAGAGTALAKDKAAKDKAPPEVVRQLVECRQIADNAARLACFDRQVAVFAEATQSHEIVVADRKDIQEAKRGLFGFAAPVGRLLGFGGGDDEATEIKRIDTKVATVRSIPNGWRLSFDEGGVWEQVDLKNFVMSPKIGQKAAITKGAFGSYFVSVNGQPGIKMRRVE